MKKQDMPKRPRRAARIVVPPRPVRAGSSLMENWADGEDMLEGLGGVDPDYDRSDDAVPPELEAQWRPSRFEGE